MQFFIKKPTLENEKRYYRVLELFKENKQPLFLESLYKDGLDFLKMLDFWRQRETEGISLYFFVNDKDIIYGACEITACEHDEAYVELVIIPNKRNQGYGKVLMQLCKNQARAIGFKNICFEVNAKQENIINFLAENGAQFKKYNYHRNGAKTIIYNICTI